MKVDLEKQRQIQKIAEEAFEQAHKKLVSLPNDGWFCDICGETHPKSGFYPLFASGPNSVSGIMCNDCARKR